MIGIAIAGSAKAQDSEFPALVVDTGHYYDEITMDKLSKLYWKLQKFDINDDAALDTYLMINECEIYSEYNYNELEWSGIRQNAKVFIKENVETFPDRFKFVQPLRLDEYDSKNGVFHIQDNYKIDGIRKFEVISKDASDQICIAREGRYIKNYPAVLLIELTQPINLTSISMTKDQAVEYINDKMQYVENVSSAGRTRDLIRSYRDAYIIMKIKIMSYKGTDYIENGVHRSIVYALLEGYEVYADREHTKLLYFQNYLRDDAAMPVDARLKDQYQALRKKRGLPEDDENKGSDAPKAADSIVGGGAQHAAPSVADEHGEEQAVSPQPTEGAATEGANSSEGNTENGVYDDLNALQQ